MKDLSGKVAVVTGGGSGIGRGTVMALAEAGMRVVVADIDETAAKTVAEDVGGLAVQVDVGDRASVEGLADAAYGAFGAVHVLHNNAGVAILNRLDATTDADWRWILSVNLDGVVNGIQAFVPRMKAQEGEKHIVNTASMAGIVAGAGLGAYNATKFAVVAISETLRQEMAPHGLGVSVLCPGVVATNIMQNSLRRRPDGGAAPDLPRTPTPGTGTMRTMDPADVGRLVRRAIENDELYIFTHPEMRPVVVSRYERILKAMDDAAALTPPG